jgi:hypothetical protein
MLTLATQLPHIYSVYSSLESDEYTLFGASTALGAALAFEASVAIFTLRIIINTKTERSRWTRVGIVAFLAVSAVANVSYYFDIAALDNAIMPMILALALPAALWLYAEEFGRGARAAAKRKVAAQTAQSNDAPVYVERFQAVCTVPGCGWRKEYATPLGAQNALNAHVGGKHRDGSAFGANGQEEQATQSERVESE